jgi:four helix bundle protein
MLNQPTYKGIDLSKKLVVACYTLTNDLPAEEKTNLAHHLRTAAVTAHINIARAAFLNNNRKNRKFIRDALNALVVIDTTVEVLVEVGFIKEEQTAELVNLSSSCYLVLDELKKDK